MRMSVKFIQRGDNNSLKCVTERASLKQVIISLANKILINYNDSFKNVLKVVTNPAFFFNPTLEIELEVE